MAIDPVSENIIKIALYLEQLIPGMVSEIWIDEKTLTNIKKTIPNEKSINNVIDRTKLLISKVKDKRRRTYLGEILGSLEFQTKYFDKKIPYGEISEKSFGYKIERVNENELRTLEEKIKDLENKIGLSHQAVYDKNLVKSKDYQSTFEKNIQIVKNILPKSILNFPDSGFIFETTSQKPWDAFNTHTAPFTSKLTLNTEIPFSTFDMLHLAYHEAYGGHHSELSNKDKLLVNSGFGEHGLVITLSPQTFISEAIADGMYFFLKINKEPDDEEQLIWDYNYFSSALRNLTTFLFNDENKSVEEIKRILSKYYVSDETIDRMIGFSTDKTYSKYAPIYYSGLNFLSDIYNKTSKKDELVETLFLKPCTPKLLTEEFGN